MLLAGAVFSAPAPTRQDISNHLRARAKTWSSHQIRVLTDAVYENAYATGVDPELVLAVMAVESDFDLRARSSVGALGLMQVMPSTGRQYANPAGVRWRGSQTLYDPVANIRIGTEYLAWLVREFHGDLPLALTSYCHGIGNVKRTLRRQGGLSRRKLRYSRRVLNELEMFRNARGGHVRSRIRRARAQTFTVPRQNFEPSRETFEAPPETFAAPREGFEPPTDAYEAPARPARARRPIRSLREI